MQISGMGRHWTDATTAALLIHAAADDETSKQPLQRWHSPIRLANTMKKQKAK